MPPPAAGSHGGMEEPDHASSSVPRTELEVPRSEKERWPSGEGRGEEIPPTTLPLLSNW